MTRQHAKEPNEGSTFRRERVANVHLLHELPRVASYRNPEQTALVVGSKRISYAAFDELVAGFANGMRSEGIGQGDRVAIYLPKTLENVVAMFAASCIGAIFVPLNPILKADQVAHILADSGARMLVTSSARLKALSEHPGFGAAVQTVVLTDAANEPFGDLRTVAYPDLLESGLSHTSSRRTLETDPVAILYTSGSTGKPKGVVLSHRNVVVGATSVAEYLENAPSDRILSLLPLSFDAGFSQLTTAFASGATVVLLDYLLPQDVVRTCERELITGITGVPPLWMQLAQQAWPESATRSLRYFANTGGKMPRDTLRRLRGLFTQAKPYLMYGLTEAFRSTYLPPGEVDARPDSIGKAIPNVEVMVVRADGSLCAPNEPGELVHRGPLVALGYWKDAERTRERYRPAPGQAPGLPNPEVAVWSGDTVTADEDGFLYFVGRQDDMIKTSGYRVSPTEIEEIAFQSGLIVEAVAIGVPHDTLGQAIALVGRPIDGGTPTDALIAFFRAKLPAYMVPLHVIWRQELARNPNGKIDRKTIKAEIVAQLSIDS
jgi:acyl-CoA ligase (AMP-forming) (exosortase A-associated)